MKFNFRDIGDKNATKSTIYSKCSDREAEISSTVQQTTYTTEPNGIKIRLAHRKRKVINLRKGSMADSQTRSFNVVKPVIAVPVLLLLVLIFVVGASRNYEKLYYYKQKFFSI